MMKDVWTGISYCIGLTLLAAPAISPARAADVWSSSEKPNILFIITDQQYIDVMSAAGNPHLKTPAMDSLAARGVRFEQSYCTYPVCTPARASLVTSRMPHEMGILSNRVCPGIPEDIPNMGSLFRAAGYRTAWAGKWHVPAPYPGFMTGRQATIPGFDVLPLEGPKHRSIPNTGPGMGSDPTTTKATLKFLAQPQDRPFLLVFSLLNPHDICEYPREPDNYPSPPAAAELPPLPANFHAIQNEPSLLAAVRGRQKKAEDALSSGSETKWREYRWAYYHLTEVVDALIGQVLEALESSPYADNTLIVFTSDHGEMAGSHQLRTKNYMYEEATAVPLIICPVGEDSATAAVDQRHLVSGLDILPTMCDYAGLPIPESLEGVSLRPLVENPNAELETAWRDYLVLEINDRTEVRMVRSDRYKYIVYAKGELREQLFDLKTDPGETTNLIQQPEMTEIVESHRNMLRQWIKQTNDTFVLAP